LGKILKIGQKLGIPGSPGGGFTSTPRGGAPRFPPGPDPVPEGQEPKALAPRGALLRRSL